MWLMLVLTSLTVWSPQLAMGAEASSWKSEADLAPLCWAALQASHLLSLMLVLLWIVVVVLLLPGSAG